MMQWLKESPSERTEALSVGARPACWNTCCRVVHKTDWFLQVMLPHMAEASNTDNTNMAQVFQVGLRVLHKTRSAHAGPMVLETGPESQFFA